MLSSYVVRLFVTAAVAVDSDASALILARLVSGAHQTEKAVTTDNRMT